MRAVQSCKGKSGAVVFYIFLTINKFHENSFEPPCATPFPSQIKGWRMYVELKMAIHPSSYRANLKQMLRKC